MQANTIKPILSEEDVRRKVKDLGTEISKDYRNRTVHVVGVLEDSFVFMADYGPCHHLTGEVPFPEGNRPGCR